MLDAAEFQRVRRRVMKDIASDFDVEKAVYRRATPHSQLHCLEFGIRKWGGAFCVDLGVHFACVPSFHSFSPSRNLKHPQPESCWLKRRWRNAQDEQFLAYGENFEQAEQTIRAVVGNSVRLLVEIEDRWTSGERLLHSLTPHVMRSDAELFHRMVGCQDLRERDQLSDSMSIRKLFPGWFPHVSTTCIVLAYLALEFDQISLIPEYLAVTQLPGQGHIMLPKTQELVTPLIARLNSR